MRRRLAEMLRRWAQRVDPQPPPMTVGAGFALTLASGNAPPGTLYFDHYSGRIFRIGTAGRAEDVTTEAPGR